jgi:hypothetical protein
MGSYLYLVGAALLVLAFLVGRSGSRNSLRARDITGNTVVGNVSGGVYQGATPQAPTPASKGTKVPPDRVAWGIGIVGVFIAIVQLSCDVLK